MHADAFSGNRPRRRPRRVIGNSWKRLLGAGMDPDRARQVRLLDEGELTLRRERFRLPELLETLRASLAAIAEQSATIMVLADGDGRVLWREGSPQVRKQADRLGFVPGSDWAERTVGTNAIGTALVVRHPVQVYSAEHFLRSHHPWTCAAAPLHDPRDGRLLGAVDVSGPADTVHPSTLALVHAVAGLAKARLWEQHRAHLDRLRAVGTPMLAKLNGHALVIDHTGWVAASTGLPPIDRVALPADLDQPRIWLPAFGTCLVEPLPGGMLLRLCGDVPTTSTRVVLDLRRPGRPTLTVHRESASWT
ncbi:MAG: GAF domain-containing protein, partial [Saccharopolyspora sp.]|nr:GAF domain-containing protein [Saccharopolyspora sp.]